MSFQLGRVANELELLFFFKISLHLPERESLKEMMSPKTSFPPLELEIEG